MARDLSPTSTFPLDGFGEYFNQLEHRIQEYSEKVLSRNEDRLNAILGILNTFRSIQYPVWHFWGLSLFTKFAKRREGSGQLFLRTEILLLRWVGLAQRMPDRILDFLLGHGFKNYRTNFKPSNRAVTQSSWRGI
jgi:hypothetical protein